METPGEALRLRGSQMGIEAESTHSKAPSQNEGPTKKTATKPSGDTANPERKRCPVKGGAISALKHYATHFYAKPERATAKQRNEVFAPAAGAMEDGGGGRLAAPIFTPPATRNGAIKRKPGGG